MTYHNLIIVGRLGQKPNLRYTPSGQAVCTLSVVSDHTSTNKDGAVTKHITWFRVSVWGKQAESVNQYLDKGRQVLIEGHLNADDSGNPRTFTRQDGTAGASYEVTAQTVKFLGSAEKQGTADEAVEFGAFDDDNFTDF